jgi:hypothetical protein
MSATLTSNVDAFLRAEEAAIKAALVAGSEVMLRRLRRDLQQGFKGGRFVTGRAANSMTRSEPERDGDGWMIRVGTNVEYVLAWSVGHLNLYTRKFERRDYFTPAGVETKNEIARVVGQVYAERMRAAGFGGA